MVEGLYRGWDELRTVAPGQQSSLRIIVLFTDGASNGVPGNWAPAGGVATAMRTSDFPKNLPDPDNQTHDDPTITGFSNTASTQGTLSPPIATSSTSTGTINARSVTSMQTITPPAPYDYMPATTWHTQHRSSGIPTTFPFFDNTLRVNGGTQGSRRSVIINPANGRYRSTLWNVNNAARNVLEIVANAARNDNGDYPIRIYTIGMGALVRYDLGTMPEKPEDILKRISNDRSSPDFNANQLEGKYFFAQTEQDVAAAYDGIQNQILRLSK
jgi:hypothetical protein